jgi:hypothetical protein
MAKQAKEPIFDTPHGHIKDRILIHETAEIPRDGLFFGLNGIQYLVKAGVEIDIPRAVRLMLDTRIRTETIKGDDGKDYTRDLKRITYTLIKEGVNIPDAAVIAEAAKETQKAPIEFP